jgi:SH3-like domain-containing protein
MRLMNKYFWLCLSAAATVAAFAEESATINRNHINVRAAPSVNSEVVTRLQKGDKVTFLEEITVEKPKKDEPAKWAAIKLPPGAKVWVFTGFLNDHTVKSPRLNLRAGPGENYSVLGRLERGAEVKEIRTMDQWMEIEPPDNARAYVDASYIDRAKPEAGQEVAQAAKPPTAVLDQKPNVYEPPTKSAPTTEAGRASVPASQPSAKPEPPVSTPPPTVAAETPKPAIPEPQPKPPEKVAENPVEKPLDTVAVKETPAPTPQPAVTKDETPVVVKPEAVVTKPAAEVPAPGPVTAPSNPGPADSDTPKRVLPPVGPAVVTPQTIPVTEKRIVRREGQIRSTKFNIQAPTYFELVGEHGRILNYVSGEKGGFKLKDYKGLRVVVTGEEGIDPRYPDRPVIELETIEVAP